MVVFIRLMAQGQVYGQIPAVNGAGQGLTTAPCFEVAKAF